MKKLVKRGRGTGHVTYLSNPSDISATAEDTNLKFSIRIDGKGY